MSAQGRPDNRQAGNNRGCGCFVIILIIVGAASFFAIARNADFPGAKTLRTAGREGKELYQQVRGNADEPGP